MSNKVIDVKVRNNMPFILYLGLIFITLKLCHVIDWSWWWVLCPVWGNIVISTILER